MNTDTGEILAKAQYEELTREKFSQMTAPWKQVRAKNLPTRAQKQLATTGRSKISRNALCPCGSMKKFKRCCATS